jgi:hypothetical protein
MMKSFMKRHGLKRIAFGAMLALAPVAASAFTITPGITTIDERGSSTGSIGFSSSDTISIEWAGAEGAGNGAFLYQAFNVDETFRLILESYVGNANDDSTANVFLGVRTRGGNNSPFTLVTRQVDENDVGDSLGSFAGGDYTIKFFEAGRPFSGTATFKIAPVPLPAGIVLLMGALGGLVVLRRRGAATTA